MKQLVIVIIALFVNLGMQGQSLNSFFNDLEDRNDIAIVTVNKEMFKMIASMNTEFEEKGVQELVRNINSLKIYVQEDTTDDELFTQARSLVQDSPMQELLNVKDGSERVYLYTDKAESDNIVKNLLLMVHDSDQNVFIRIDGKVNLHELAKVADNLGIEGIEHFKKLDE